MTAPEQWFKTCPLCGGDNQCAIAAGRPGETCWCVSATIGAAALAAIPAESVGKRCICPACGRGKGETLDER
ncbi:MAG: cysteine-rich CWC family protein [Halioglobus sp.]|nr:cysteine-rich CWC family protein [Halioglobus sp.]